MRSITLPSAPPISSPADTRASRPTCDRQIQTQTQTQMTSAIPISTHRITDASDAISPKFTP